MAGGEIQFRCHDMRRGDRCLLKARFDSKRKTLLRSINLTLNSHNKDADVADMQTTGNFFPHVTVTANCEWLKCPDTNTHYSSSHGLLHRH